MMLSGCATATTFVGLMLRPSRIRAASKGAAHMIPDAFAMAGRYPRLTCPLTILTGDADAIGDLSAQALRLHAAVPASKLDVFAGVGHMTITQIPNVSSAQSSR
jgi:pimeloyl-ACP methyl ester carboxylesterase